MKCISVHTFCCAPHCMVELWRAGGGDKRWGLTPPTKHVYQCIVAICSLNVRVALLYIFERLSSWYSIIPYHILGVWGLLYEVAANWGCAVIAQRSVVISYRFFFYVLLTVHPNIIFFYQLDEQIIYFSTFVIPLYMFRALVLIFRRTVV